MIDIINEIFKFFSLFFKMSIKTAIKTATLMQLKNSKRTVKNPVGGTNGTPVAKPFIPSTGPMVVFV